MRNKAYSILLFAAILSILVPGITLAQNSYNAQAAVNYANIWWNGRNPAYNDYSASGGDCANFVSQCLIAGGLDLSGYGTDSRGCLTTCTNLHSYLTQYPGVTWETRPKGQVEPLWFLPGDPAIFGYSDAHPRTHAVFAVTGDATHYATCNAHSTDQYHKTVRWFYDNSNYDRCTFYHIPPANNPPVVNAFNVTPISVTLGNSFTISYTVSDDIGLQQTELWRANDVGGAPDPAWPNNPIVTTPLSGQTSYPGSFTNAPSSVGTYWYGMHVVDNAGKWNDEQNSWTGGIPGDFGPIQVTVVPLSPPTGVSASDGTYTDKISITWNSVSGASEYRVYRATSSGGAKTAISNWQSGISYNDTSATLGITYYYWVKAGNSYGESDYSSYDTGWRRLLAPTAVSASDGTYTDKVQITWNSVTGASYYRVYRATSSGGTKTALGSWQSSTAYNDTSAVAGTTYYYWVTAAVSSSGDKESDYSSYDTGWRAIPPDTTPPSPNPMTWETEPYETSTSSISMTATAATDSYPSLPVYYEFDFYSSPTGGTGGDDRGWDTSRSYPDSGLQPNHQYGYRVRARDSAPAQNATDYSVVSYDYTDVETPSGITFGTPTTTSIPAKSTNMPSGLNRGSSGLIVSNVTNGTNSGWKQNNDFWASSPLSVNTQYGFKARSRNGDGDETGDSPTAYRYTLANAPSAAPFSNVTQTSIQANWTANGNPSGTQFWCENTTLGTNSGWTSDIYWNEGDLTCGTQYCYRIRARNGDGVETGWTDLDCQTTLMCEIPPMDLNNDGIVNFSDFAIFAFYWMDDTCSDPDWCEGSDSDYSGRVDFVDLLNFVDYWLWCRADLDLDGDVDFVDFADLNKSGSVDLFDLAEFAEHWLEGITP